MFSRFKKLETADTMISRIQDNVEQAIKQLPTTEIIQGRLLINVSLVSGSINFVDHKLGRKLIGWKITRIRANSIIWDSQDTNVSPDKLLSLNCNNNVTVDIWVF